MMPPERAEQPLRIAQVAPLFESVPPKRYGGTERVVSYLTEELVHAGHQVTLFASGDSVTSAELVPMARTGLRLDDQVLDPLAHQVLMLETVSQRARDFDVVHFHWDYLHFPLARRLGVPQVTTLHNRLDTPDLRELFREFRDLPLVSISRSHQGPLPWANWVASIHHGIPPELHTASYRPGDYFVFIGRVSPEKRLDRAIAIARRLGIPLRVGAKVEEKDRAFYESEVLPLLGDPLIEFLGEIDEARKGELLRGALALLFPIDWPEPFGLVMIEAMACGTPVIAFRRGAVPEVLDDGVTGFVVDDLEAAVHAAKQAVQLDRRSIRRVFEQRFAAARMAGEYVSVYRTLIDRGVLGQNGA